jgi:UDPglucose 6-dehydrogenase
LSVTAKEKGLEIASNPEFLAEGTALADFMQPSRIVVGAASENVANSVMTLYEGIDAPRVICSLTSAETIKHASNSLLSVRLSFVNELAALSEKTGADIKEVLSGMSLDPRIGDKFMKPGPGWGGSCFPKDTSELAFTSRQLGSPMLTVEAAIQSNKNSISSVTHAVRNQLGGELSGKRIAVWGLAFKAHTDDTRQSPALAVIDSLLNENATVVVYDPLAKIGERTNLEVAESAAKSCVGADGLIVLTEWPEFALEDPVAIGEVMAPSAMVYDARGILNAAEWKKTFTNFKTLGQM